MSKKLMLILFVAITAGFVLLVATVPTKADEVAPQKKPIELKIKGWVTDEWNDIKEYQANSWQQGKEQLARNKQQILDLFSKVTNN